MKRERDQRSLGEQERAEECRRHAVETREDAMSASEYRESLEKEYGHGKWADRMVDEMVDSRAQKALQSEEAESSEREDEKLAKRENEGGHLRQGS